MSDSGTFPTGTLDSGTFPAGTPTGNARHRQPREQLERRGARCLSDAEVLAVLLGNGSLPTAQALVDCTDGSIYQMSRWAILDFVDKGLTWARACNLVAAFELARRFEDRHEISGQLAGARDIFDFFNKKSLPLDQEKCWVICMDIRSRVLRYDEITSGTGSASLFHPRDFLRSAIRCNAAKIVLVHNHPSGDASPSAQDTEITRRLVKACEVLEIALMDHVIIGRASIPPHRAGYFSYFNAGML